MGNASADTILSAAEALIVRDISIHWLQAMSKRPVEKQWTTRPKHTLETARRAYHDGYNLGIRTGEPSKTRWGYLHVIDVDIRDPSQKDDAWVVVREACPALLHAPYVISGSGGESRHLYFFTDKPFRKLTLGKSQGFTHVFSQELGRDVKKYDWEVQLCGSGNHVAAPPSIHPDTGRPYVWGREIDFDLLDMDMGPVVDSSIVESWGALDDLSVGGDEDDDLIRAVKLAPMGLTDEEIDRTLADLPEYWVDDRDCWYRAGMALHHEYEGRAAGFDKWTEWSKGSQKYNPKDQAYVWKSFGKHRGEPIRMASLIQAAGEERDRREGADWLDEFEVDSQSSTGKGQSLVPYAVEVDLQAATGTPSLEDLFDLASSVPEASRPVEHVFDDEKPDEDWESNLDRNEDGLAKASLPNLELIVRNDPRTNGIVAFNEFSQEIVLIKEPSKRKSSRRGANKPIRQLDTAIWKLTDPINGSMWTDSHDNSVRVMLEAPKSQGGRGFKVADRDLRSAVDLVAQKRRFHPIRSYLKSLSWDGQARVETLFIDYLGSPDTPFHREAAMLFMIGAVTRVFEPGHKFDFVPILKGLQGKRKSTFVDVLARHWFGELDGDVHDKKSMVETMQGCWIMELPELSAFSKAEVNILKAFVSKKTDKVRMAYAKRAVEFKRQCVFIGTTNEDEPLKDPTGNRRFWMILCNVAEIDIEGLRENVDQLWAEATAMYHAWRQRHPHDGLPLYLRNPDAQMEAQQLQEAHRQERTEDTLVGLLEEWLDSPISDGFDDLEGQPAQYRNEVCGVQIWVELMGRDRFSFTPRDQQYVSAAINKLSGWVKDGNRRIDKWGKQRIYVRKEPK